MTTVTPIERNRVNLTFSVVEGDTARIKDIRIVGNKAFSESTLKGLFDQDTGGWLSWYTKSDRYARTKLNADLETLRSYYLQRGTWSSASIRPRWRFPGQAGHLHHRQRDGR